jgi:hypothetical protein
VYVGSLYNKKFRRITRRVICHSPILLRKSIVKDMINTFQEEFRATSSFKFRNKKDMQYSFSFIFFYLSFLCVLFLFLFQKISYSYFLIHKNEYGFIRKNPNKALFFGSIKETNRKDFIPQLLRNKVKFICLNDDLDYSKDNSQILSDFKNKFETLYNRSSIFELEN